jgi:curved DNA-binding protein CbpA
VCAGDACGEVVMSAMSLELYDDLGIEPEASPEVVHKAYRALAKLYHPDRNPGDDDAKAMYALVDRAYRVLSDDERRAKYDRTGEVDSPKPDNTFGEIMAVLSPCLFSVLREIAQKGGRLTEEDVVTHMTTVFKAKLKEADKVIRELESQQVMLGMAGERFTVEKGQPDLFAAAIKDHQASLDDQVKQVTRESNCIRKAIEYLKGCRYKTDAKKLITQITRVAWMTV